MSEKIDIDKELEEGGNAKAVNKDKKSAIMAAAAFVIIIAVCVVFAILIHGSHYLSTDNAKVMSDIYTLVPKTDGKLLRFDAYEGKRVKSGEVIGRAEGGPYIKAPTDGEIIKVDAKKGDYVSASDVIGIVANTEHMYISANIEEGDITKVQTGQSVKVTLDAYGSKTYEGVVTNVNNITSNAISGNVTSYSTSGTYTKTTQLIPIEISLVNAPVELDRIIGTNATVKIKIK